MKRRLIGGVLLLALAGMLMVAYRSDRLLFEIPTDIARHSFEKVGHEMAKHHGLAFLMTFDEANPVEWIGRGPVLYPGTESVRGKYGQARRFDGRTHTHLSTSAPWPILGSNYTLSLWVKLEPTGMDQEVWYNFSQQQFTGFKLVNGQMTFYTPGKPDQVAAYPFEAFGRFVHLAAVVDGAAGEARLYEDGALKATIPITAVIHPAHNLEFGKTRWYVVNAPLCGALDEAAAWKKALSPEDIRRLAHVRQSLPRTLEAFPYWRWRIMQTLQTAIPATLKMLDRFNPALHAGRAAAVRLPEIQLHFSANDARHFMRAHDRSLASGRRTAKGANPRRIFAQYEGKTVKAQACLDGSDTRYASSRRPSFILQTPDDAPAFGSRWLRLIPPENMESGLPGIGTALAKVTRVPTPDQGLCRLLINGQFKGIYYFESFVQNGQRPGVAKGSSNPAKWARLFQDMPPEPVVPSDNQEAQLDQARRLLVNDIFLPWSSREWTYLIRKCQSTPRPPQPQLISPFAILGENPSPYYILGDLDLQAFQPGPMEIVWHSSRPDLIDATGKVTRPAGDLPVGVELTAILRDGTHSETSTLPFRVMPGNPKLSALMLYMDEPLSNAARVDFLARYYPAREGGPPRWLQGGQATRGGIKHRGNTSYWRGTKKPFSLRFDEPHQLIGAPPSTHLYLLNGYVDPTKLRNKLEYDLFRALRDEQRPRYAPEIDWIEIFVNGEYFGVYEMCTRIDEDMLGYNNEDAANPAALPALYKIRASESLFAEDRTDEFEQVFPSASRVQHDEPLQALMTFTSHADPEKFAREIGDWLDLDNAIDFLLLLNFSGNADGRTTNFYLARDGKAGARFIFVPWDYDHTFGGRGRWLSNFLFNRLRRDFPGFQDRMRQRWSELRQGLLADAALAARLDDMGGRLTGYMDWEYALLQYPVPPTYTDNVAELKRAVQVNVDYVDAKLGYTNAPANGNP